MGFPALVVGGTTAFHIAISYIQLAAKIGAALAKGKLDRFSDAARIAIDCRRDRARSG